MSPTPAPKQENRSATRKLGPLEISGSWRVRAEGWNWFQSDTGDSDYGFAHSLFRVTVGQHSDRFDWQIEGAQDAILGLPSSAVAPNPQGQLGLGGTYYVSNGNSRNTANGFVKQAYFRVKAKGPLRFEAGRFEFLDGVEVVSKDPDVAALAETRVAQRLVGNFGWSAVGRSFDGIDVSFDRGKNSFTFVGVRPTRGVYQADGMGELDIDLVYGSYIRPVTTKHGSGRLRVFAIGYLDHRESVLKTDNRPMSVRATDRNSIQIGTYGADYLEVIDAGEAGKFTLVLWGLIQNGAWGTQTQRSSAYLAEFGWQPRIDRLKPALAIGYSHGSGDTNANDSTHGTFFQILPTPRPYARFPFWNMEDNDDLYAVLRLAPTQRLNLRSEWHSLKLAEADDLWYVGGGAFQPRTFGYTGRPSGGDRGLASVWDVSADYRITKNFGVGTYYGHAWGKSVVTTIYPQDANGQFAYLETNLRF
jgi:hypothetical protein